LRIDKVFSIPDAQDLSAIITIFVVVCGAQVKGVHGVDEVVVDRDKDGGAEFDGL